MSLLYPDESYLMRGIAFDVYKQLRDNHKEIIYHNAFCIGLRQKGVNVEKEKRINVFYGNTKVGTYIPDLVVDNKILVELKAKPKLIQDDIKQFWHYLKCSEYKLGFLINFGSKDGVDIVRRVYDKARDKAFVRGSA